MTIEADDYNRFTIWTILAAQFAPPFMFSGVAVALPALGADLHAGATSLGLIETLFLATSLAFLLPAGRLLDSYDKSFLYKGSLIVFSVSSIAIGSLSSITGIHIIRSIQGLAAAVSSVAGPALITELVPAKKRGRVFGQSIGMLYAGLTIGPLIAGILVSSFGWRSVFRVGGIGIFISYLLIQLRLPSTFQRAVLPKGLSSAVLLLMTTLSVVGATSFVHHGNVTPVFVITGLISAALFFVSEKRSDKPFIDLTFISERPLLRDALLVQLLLYLCATRDRLSSMPSISMGRTTSLGDSKRKRPPFITSSRKG